MLVLAPGIRADLHGQARDAAPAECCGLLTGTDTPVPAAGAAGADGIVISAIHPSANGDADCYHIPPATFLAVERAARTAGDWVCGVYHSHPAGSAVPSETDAREAWPGLVYVIIAGTEMRAWRLDDECGFTEVPVDPGQP